MSKGMKKFRALLLLFFVTLLIPSAAFASMKNKQALRALPALYVEVLHRGSFSEIGWEEAPIRVEIENKLKAAGIKVYARRAKELKPDSPYMSLVSNIQCPPTTGMCGFNVNLSLTQTALLIRDPSLLGKVYTWEVGVTGMVDKKSVSYIRTKISDLIDEFVKDYREVNPSSPKKK